MEDQSPLRPRRVKSPREFIPTRQSLLLRLKNHDDARSWEDFFNTDWKLIYSLAKHRVSDLIRRELQKLETDLP